MSVTALVSYTEAAQKAGIKPIIGARLRLVDDIAWRKPPKKEGKAKPQAEYFVTWYVLSEAGLKALYKLLTLANDEAHFYFTAKLGFDDFFAALDSVTAEDVAIALESAHSVAGHPDATRIAQRVKASVSASNAFLALCPVNTPYYDTMNKRQIELGAAAGLEFIVQRPVLYPAGGADALETLSAVYKNEKLSDPWHASPYTRDLHALTVREMQAEVLQAANRLSTQRGMAGFGPKFGQALRNTDRLVSMVKYEWQKEPISLPKMADDEFQTVVDKCKAGWAKRFAAPVFGHRPSSHDLKTIYQPRLVYELGVLKRLNFSGYFLLTDIVILNADRFISCNAMIVKAFLANCFKT